MRERRSYIQGNRRQTYEGSPKYTGEEKRSNRGRRRHDNIAGDKPIGTYKIHTCPKCGHETHERVS